jgi:hypothetical protein
MTRIAWACILIVTLAVPLHARDRGVEVHPGDRELFEVKPRHIVTTTFRVTNTGAESREFLAKLTLPDGWQAITEDFAFDLKPEESETRLVSFFVPQNTLAGKYQITYLVEARKYPSVYDLHAIYVVVLPVTKLSVTFLDAPDYVVAGDTYTASFSVTNESNVATQLQVTGRSGDNLPYSLDRDTFQLAPGESRTVTASVTTEREITRRFKHRLQLTAFRTLDASVRADAVRLVEVIPRMSETGERYHSIPMELTLRQVADKDGGWTGGFQADLSGSGTLDEEGEKNVTFHLRGPDTLDQSRFGQRDEYYLSLWTNRAALHLGDRPYSLTTLTERHLYARGIEGTVTLNPIRAGAYYLNTRWLHPHEEQAAGYVSYALRDNLDLGLNYLRKEIDDEQDDIVSARGQYRPFDLADIEAEYASGSTDNGDREHDQAYLVSVSGTHPWLSYYLRYIHAGPNYPGNYVDTDELSANLSFSPIEDLALRGSFRYDKDNLDRDPAESSAGLEKYYEFGAQYTLPTDTNLFLDVRYRDRQDRFSAPTFDYDERTVRLGVGQRINKVSLYASGEFGETRDHVDHDTSRVQRYNASVHVIPAKGLSVNGYVYYDTHADSRGDTRRKITTGIGGHSSLGYRTALDLDARTSTYLESGIEDEHDVRATLTHTLKTGTRLLDGHRIALNAWYTERTESDPRRETALMLEYTIPFRVPLKRKKGIGTVKGRLYDEETGVPVSDIILRLNGATAVSDHRGTFLFPSVKPGVYYLDIDRTSMDLDHLPALKLPREVAVQGGADTVIDIGITEKATVTGRVILYRFESAGDTSSAESQGDPHYVVPDQTAQRGVSNGGDTLVEAQGLRGILLELSNDTETLRRLTDADGHFRFEEVRPGRWTLHVVPRNIPEYHVAEHTKFELELTPGEGNNLSIRVLPKKRPIQMLNEGETITEEERPRPIVEAGLHQT